MNLDPAIFRTNFGTKLIRELNQNSLRVECKSSKTKVIDHVTHIRRHLKQYIWLVITVN